MSNSPPKQRVRALFFDLDGTLVDSFADLTTAVNLTRQSYGLALLPLAQVKRHVGDGIHGPVTTSWEMYDQVLDS